MLHILNVLVFQLVAASASLHQSMCGLHYSNFSEHVCPFFIPLSPKPGIQDKAVPDWVLYPEGFKICIKEKPKNGITSDLAEMDE